ncbi:MAG: PHP domain-containing protein, partial [Candidatus Limnocylindrales bacterium]
MADPAGTKQAFFDLHCHTSYSFDSLARPRDQVQAAAARGLTHLAITDHDTIVGALEGRDQAPAGLTVIIGEEVKTADGDLVCLFLERALPPGRPAAETIAAAREQGGLVGIPHPFDRHRNSLLRDAGLASLAG